jgi:large subunit ribosomal protein L3
LNFLFFFCFQLVYQNQFLFLNLMKCILGKKMSMTQIWVDDKVVGVTPLMAGPCVITQVKNKEKDGYEALQLAYGERKEKNIKKPQRGHFKKTEVKPAHVREFRLEKAIDFKIGDVVSVEAFAVGEVVSATGVSKGRGFQGVVKRHGFHGFRKTHGNKDQERMPGSIGPKGPAHVFKGTRMGGRMGGDRVTVTNLKIVAIDAEKNILFVSGALPGALNSLVIIKNEGELQVNLKKNATVSNEEAKMETSNEEIKTEVPAEENKSEEVKAEVLAEEVEEEAKAQEVKAEVKDASVEEVKSEEAKTETNS